MKQELLGFANISVQRIQDLLQIKLKILHPAAKKPLLTQRMMKKRLAFCKKYLKLTPTQWENVMFSDESTFHLVNSSGTKVRRARGISRYKQRYTIPIMKHRASVMVWGCFSRKKGRGVLYFLPKNCVMNRVCTRLFWRITCFHS